MQITTTGANGQTTITPTPAGQPGLFSIEAAINGDDVVFAGSANMPLASGAAKLEANEFANCGLTTAGAAWCWGWAASQEFGNTDTPSRPSRSPRKAFCALEGSGTVYCWETGLNGNQTSSPEFSPTAIQQAGLTFSQLAALYIHACALTSTGAAYFWGANDHAELGSVSASGRTPVAVSGGYTFKTILPGGASTCGLTTSNAMLCWGSNVQHQLGLGFNTDTVYRSPVPVPRMGYP